jgi:flagellar biosynthesis/type III secretory pathway protein FliH
MYGEKAGICCAISAFRLDVKWMRKMTEEENKQVLELSLEKSYEERLKKGYDEGYKKGYKEGYEKGHEEGLIDAYYE